MRTVHTRHLGPAVEALEMHAIFENDVTRADHDTVIDHYVIG